MLKLTGAQALVRLLAQERVPFVFGVVGGKLAPLLHALSQQSAMRYIGLRHEAAGPMMAAAVAAGSVGAGHAAATAGARRHSAGAPGANVGTTDGLGRVCVALGEMGPGALNLAAGLGGAFANHLPVLAITSNQHRAAGYPHAGMFMDLDTRALLAPITRWNAVVHDGRRLPELLRRALREALGPKPGPVHLDIPHDVLSGVTEFADDEFDLPPARYRALHGARPAAAEVQAACALLRAARRPLIVAGGGVLASGAAAVGAIQRLARQLKAPLLPTQMALGVLPSTHPHFIGQGGLIAGEPVWRAFEHADVVLAVGCRWSSWMWNEHGPLARRDQAVISINTDDAALGGPALHQVAMPADAGQALDDLLAALGPAETATDGDWLPGLLAQRARYCAQLQGLATAPGAGGGGGGGGPSTAAASTRAAAPSAQADDTPPAMHPAALARAIAEALPADALCCFDGGHTSFWSNDFTAVHGPGTHLHEPGMSQLGFGLPAAMALQLLHPSRPVFNLTGDGSFGFTLNELDSARRHGLPVVTLIHNNAAWGIIQMGQRKALGFELGSDLSGTDYAAVARGFGCYGETVTRPEDIAPAIARALASGLPAVIDAHTRFVPHPAMPGFGSMNRYGFEALTRRAAAPGLNS